MKKWLKYFLLTAVALIVLFPFTQTTECYANSAEPPSIMIIVSNAPEDLEIRLLPEGTEASKTTRSYETYYSFYLYELQQGVYSFEVSSGGESFTVKLERPIQKYNNIYTLDLKNQSLASGKSLSRSAFLIFSRVTLTLLVEGLVFLLFGYRRKRSWLVFLGINLATQLALWIWLNGTSPFHAGYVIFTLFFAEILIFMIEMPAFLILVNEHRRLRTAAYVIIANVLSLLAGIFLISALPI
ncbi:MAG: hypothetical protein PHH02_04785 [Dehalococcoidales bacterium]|nr:hypothetical protein [Dehalococcoidales bacterium]MDD5122185.1 hypothetical protein [Dehalococcoidales bacterium]